MSGANGEGGVVDGPNRPHKNLSLYKIKKYDKLSIEVIMSIIKPLLEYQAREREKLALLATVDGGKTKKELDEATRAREAASGTVKQLAHDAGVLLGAFETASKNLAEIFKKIESYGRDAKIDAGEEGVTTDMTFVSGLLSKVSGYESQLADIAAKSTTIKNVYEKSVTSAKRAAEVMASASVKFEKETKDVAPKLSAIDADLKKLAAAVDPVLMEKYKQIRKQAKKGDVVVPIAGNCCGGCRFELPSSLIHTAASRGYIICEECGKIIYKG